MIKRYQAGRAAHEVPGSDPVHYRVKYLGNRQFVVVAVRGPVDLPVTERVVRPSALEARLDCILSGQREMRLSGARSFTIEED